MNCKVLLLSFTTGSRSDTWVKGHRRTKKWESIRKKKSSAGSNLDSGVWGVWTVAGPKPGQTGRGRGVLRNDNSKLFLVSAKKTRTGPGDS